MNTTLDWVMVAIKMLGALGLLIFGMRMMSEALQKLAGSQLRVVLGKMTTNRFTGMLTGAFVTSVVQSSSATTVMTVSFVSAGLLSLSQAISVIMGANIGTTLTSWIMSLGYSMDFTNIIFPIFTIGIFLIYRKSQRNLGDFLFGVAFMLFSLVMLSSAGKDMDLEHNEAVLNFFASFDTSSHLTIIIFLAIGTVITCVVQSSAAVMAITIMLCSTGVLPIYLGIALVMGENIGTTATANLAAMGAGTQARRAALAHLLFNVFGVIWVMCVFYPFVNGVCGLVGYNPSLSGQAERLPVVLAMFHTCFNVANTAILIGLIPLLERAVCWIIPSKSEYVREEFKLQYIEGNIMQTPEIAVMQAQKETAHLGDRVQLAFGLVRELLEEPDSKVFSELYSKIQNQEDIIDQVEIGIARYLDKVSSGHLSDNTKMETRQMLRQISELESIGDSCFNLSRTMNRSRELGLNFNDYHLKQIRAMMKLCDESLTLMNQIMKKDRNMRDLRDIFRIENDINHLRNTLKADNIRAVNDLEYGYSVGTMYMDLVNECEKLGDYVVNVAQARFGK